MKRPFHNRASRDVRPRRRLAARRSMVSPGARLVRVEHEHVGRVEGGSIKPIATRPQQKERATVLISELLTGKKCPAPGYFK